MPYPALAFPPASDSVTVAGEETPPEARRFLHLLRRLRAGLSAGGRLPGDPAGRVTVAPALEPVPSLLEAPSGQIRRLAASLAACHRSVAGAPAVRRHLLLGFAPSGGALARLGNAGLAGLVQAWAARLGARGATIHLLLPGGEGSETALARLAVFLLSPQADWLTGSVQAAPGAALPPGSPGATPGWPAGAVPPSAGAEEVPPPEPGRRGRGHVFVAAAGSDFGRAAALLWASRRASLALCDDAPDEELAAAVRRAGGIPLPVPADLRSAAAAEEALHRACHHFGPLETLLVGLRRPPASAAPAGGAAGAPTSLGEEAVEAWFERELLDVWQLLRLAGACFGPEGGAVVVDAGAASAREAAAEPLAAALARARAALVAELAGELLPAGIRVNGVARSGPAAAPPPRAGTGGGAARGTGAGGRALLPRPVPPLEDVVEVARWLAGPEAPLAGAVLAVDAGAAVP